jgi:plasmid maintenance system antidote protein VapI
VDSELVLVEQYEEYQRLMRERHRLYFGLDLEVEAGKDEHPFRQLRSRIDVTPTEVAKSLCIPQATIVHFEKHVKQQQSVPKCILNVLHEIGYKHEQIINFQNEYKLFRMQSLGTNVRKIG